jgi:hypothetical protein
LGNELLNEALTSIEKKYMDGWLHSKPHAADVREKAYVMLHVLKEFKYHLTHIMETGKLASTAQEDRIGMQERERILTEWDGSPDGRT